MSRDTSGIAFVTACTTRVSPFIPSSSSLRQHALSQRVTRQLRQPNNSTRRTYIPTCNNASGSSSSSSASSSPQSSSSITPTPNRVLQTVATIIKTSTNLFPLWVLLGAIAAVYYPPSFLWFKSQYIPPMLSVIMLGMSLTLPMNTFSVNLIQKPRQIIIGVLSQYLIMPSLGYMISKLFHLSVPLTAGLILVSVCPGGAASNVVCLLSKADVGLSVILTLTSTILSILLIPFLMSLLVGTLIPVNPVALLLSTLQVVLLPLVVGFCLKPFVNRFMAVINVVLPLISVIGVTLICGAVVATNSPLIFSSASVGITRLVGAIAMMHGLGGLLGFVVAKICNLDNSSCRTISIEVMMQNSSLAVSLANLHLGNGITAIPGAISATLHSIFGSILAGYWRYTDDVEKRKKERLMLSVVTGDGDGDGEEEITKDQSGENKTEIINSN